MKDSSSSAWPEVLLVSIAVVVVSYLGICAFTLINHIFSGSGEPTPFLASIPAFLLAFAAMIVVVILTARRTITVYGQCNGEEKEFLRKVALAIFKRAKRSDGPLGKNARAIEEFYRDVKDESK